MTLPTPFGDGFASTHTPAKSDKQHIAYLDGLRALAVLMVLLRHAWGLSGSPELTFAGIDLTRFVVMGGSGVDLFFVLSGYLLTRSYFTARQTGRDPVPYGVYWRARIRRIGPPYWVVLFLVLLLMTGQYIPEERVFSGIGVVILVAHVLFAQGAYLPSFGAYHVETPFWTLTIEMVFYLLVPFLVRLFYGRRWMVSTPLLAAVALGWLYLVRNSVGRLVLAINGPLNVFPPFPVEVVRFFLSHQMPAFLVDFAAGILAALVVTSKKHALRDAAWFQRLTSPRMGVGIFALGLLTVLLAAYKMGRWSLVYGYANPLNYMTQSRRGDLLYYYSETIPYGIGYGGMLLGLALATGWLQRVFSFRPLAYIGVIGYSVYLLHMPLIYVFNSYSWLKQEGDPHRHFLLMLLTAVPTILLVASGFFYAVEKPSMAWSRRAQLRNAPAPGSARAAEPSSARAVEPGATSPAENAKTGEARTEPEHAARGKAT